MTHTHTHTHNTHTSQSILKMVGILVRECTWCIALVVEMLGSRYAARSASNSSGSSGMIGSALGSSFGVGEDDPNPKKLMLGIKGKFGLF